MDNEANNTTYDVFVSTVIIHRFCLDLTSALKALVVSSSHKGQQAQEVVNT